MRDFATALCCGDGKEAWHRKAGPRLGAAASALTWSAGPLRVAFYDQRPWVAVQPRRRAALRSALAGLSSLLVSGALPPYSLALPLFVLVLPRFTTRSS